MALVTRKAGGPSRQPEEQATSGKSLRVLMATHSHPRLTYGGAEIAAEALANGLRTHCGATTWMLGCSRKDSTSRLGIELTQPFGLHDFVYRMDHRFHHFNFANRDPKFPRMFRELLEQLEPDVVHFHHYTNFGVEAFAIAKRVDPSIRVVLTLHEFLAICHHHGQMVKTKGNRLCTGSGQIECAECFPPLGARDFFLRKRYILKHFEHVDLFISPSEFLMERYIEWGLPAEKAVVIPNVIEERPRVGPVGEIGAGDRLVATRKRQFRFGFFGQMSPLKGINVLLEAALQLHQDEVEDISIEIYGDYSNQPDDFQRDVVAALDKVTDNVRYHGPYENARVLDLMRQVDVVVVPSIWWENSPVVIEEALLARRPVLCSNIGGMAEKVRPGIDGWWFEAGQSHSLAATMREVVARLAKGAFASMRVPVDGRAVAEAHCKEYNVISLPISANRKLTLE